MPFGITNRCWIDSGMVESCLCCLTEDPFCCNSNICNFSKYLCIYFWIVFSVNGLNLQIQGYLLPLAAAYAEYMLVNGKFQPTLQGALYLLLANLEPGGCFTNVLRALQNILLKFLYCRNHSFYENFKLKIWTCAQSLLWAHIQSFSLKFSA